MKTILVNVASEETRMALIEENRLCEVAVERPTEANLVGNIYLGRVQNVLPGMQAAFVDIGGKKHAFLYIGNGMPPDVVRETPHQKTVHIGQHLLVQVVKDAVGTKGPRVTTHISLPGRNLVLLPLSAYISLSHRITDDAERERLRSLAASVCPPGMGLIVRTVAAGQDKTFLADEVRYLVHLWETVQARSRILAAPALLYRDADLAVRMVRDVMTDDVGVFYIDDEVVHRRICELLAFMSPALVPRVQYFDARAAGKSLFATHNVEDAFAHIGDRIIELPSGGFLVLDKTEALTVIDVNTGKYVGKQNLSDTAYRMNMEAAVEILRQIRLRDLGGIIIVDFIDMETEAQKERLLEYMRAEAKRDRVKTNVVGITALGLVEITRKKSRQNIEGVLYTDCPCCGGRGRVESAETVGVHICRDIRRIEQHTHAPFGYEVEVAPEVRQILTTKDFFRSLSASLGIEIHLTARAGRHPERYTITQYHEADREA